MQKKLLAAVCGFLFGMSLALPTLAEQLTQEDFELAFKSHPGFTLADVEYLTEQELLEDGEGWAIVQLLRQIYLRIYGYAQTMFKVRAKMGFDKKEHPFRDNWPREKYWLKKFDKEQGTYHHFQLTYWFKGVKGSHEYIRIPYGRKIKDLTDKQKLPPNKPRSSLQSRSDPFALSSGGAYSDAPSPDGNFSPDSEALFNLFVDAATKEGIEFPALPEGHVVGYVSLSEDDVERVFAHIRAAARDPGVPKNVLYHLVKVSIPGVTHYTDAETGQRMVEIPLTDEHTISRVRGVTPEYKAARAAFVHHHFNGVLALLEEVEISKDGTSVTAPADMAQYASELSSRLANNGALVDLFPFGTRYPRRALPTVDP